MNAVEAVAGALGLSGRQPAVSVQARGVIGLNRAAYDLLGCKPYVHLTSPGQGSLMLYIQGSDEPTPTPVRQKGTSQTWLLQGTAVLTYAGYRPITPAKFTPKMVHGVMTVSLSIRVQFNDGEFDANVWAAHMRREVVRGLRRKFVESPPPGNAMLATGFVGGELRRIYESTADEFSRVCADRCTSPEYAREFLDAVVAMWRVDVPL